MNDHEPARSRSYRYYDLVMAAFVTVLLCSNLIGPAKTCALPFPIFGMRVFGAGNIFFPIAYIFGDVLTEVYGYARARKVIWAGFGAMIFATIMSQIVIRMPPADSEPYNKIIQPAIQEVFGSTWRIVAGSILAFWAGDFVNSFVLAKMKIWTAVASSGCARSARRSRTARRQPDLLSSGLLGRLGDEDARRGRRLQLGIQGRHRSHLHAPHLPSVGFLKKAEHEDFYDRETNFTPFSLED